jgi:hypothetical protein
MMASIALGNSRDCRFLVGCWGACEMVHLHQLPQFAVVLDVCHDRYLRARGAPSRCGMRHENEDGFRASMGGRGGPRFPDNGTERFGAAGDGF